MKITREQYDVLAGVVDAVKNGYSDDTEMQDTDQYVGAILSAIGASDPYTPPPVSTINSLVELGLDVIQLRPVLEENVVRWELYIPPTTVDAFEVTEDGEVTDELKEPYGVHYWDTFEGALTSLRIASRNGQIKFNDGCEVS